MPVRPFLITDNVLDEKEAASFTAAASAASAAAAPKARGGKAARASASSSRVARGKGLSSVPAESMDEESETSDDKNTGIVSKELRCYPFSDICLCRVVGGGPKPAFSVESDDREPGGCQSGVCKTGINQSMF